MFERLRFISWWNFAKRMLKGKVDLDFIFRSWFHRPKFWLEFINWLIESDRNLFVCICNFDHVFEIDSNEQPFNGLNSGWQTLSINQNIKNMKLVKCLDLTIGQFSCVELYFSGTWLCWIHTTYFITVLFVDDVCLLYFCIAIGEWKKNNGQIDKFQRARRNDLMPLANFNHLKWVHRVSVCTMYIAQQTQSNIHKILILLWTFQLFYVRFFSQTEFKFIYLWRELRTR